MPLKIAKVIVTWIVLLTVAAFSVMLISIALIILGEWLEHALLG